MLARLRRTAFGTLHNRSTPVSKMTAIPERAELDTEYRAGGKAVGRYAQPRHISGTRQFGSPGHILSVTFPGRPSIFADKHEEEFGVVGLRYEPRDHPGHGGCPGLFEHRERVV